MNIDPSIIRLTEDADANAPGANGPVVLADAGLALAIHSLPRRRRVYFLALVSLSLLAAGANSQETQTLVRADGASVPVRVRGLHGASCQGVAIISPGAGGSEKGMEYIALALSRGGWLSVVVGHRESGPLALRAKMRGQGMKDALVQLTTDRLAYDARSMDLGAALDWARPQCSRGYSVLIGHSMGAATAMLEAGADNRLDLTGKDRFDAYVAMSPQGPGSIFPGAAWRQIRKPVLMLTGTRDDALEGAWTSRTIPYDDMPAGCKWLGVIDGATHINFAGIGLSRKTEALTIRAMQTFLNTLAAGRCGPLPDEDGIAYKHK
jgi:predicted dienelactone hydrolase